MPIREDNDQGGCPPIRLCAVRRGAAWCSAVGGGPERCDAVQYRAVPYCVVQCHTVPYRAVPCRAVCAWCVLVSCVRAFSVCRVCANVSVCGKRCMPAESGNGLVRCVQVMCEEPKSHVASFCADHLYLVQGHFTGFTDDCAAEEKKNRPSPHAKMIRPRLLAGSFRSPVEA